MKMIPFVKMHGAGNDFILVDDRAGDFPIDDHRRIAAMATRPDGIGCDTPYRGVCPLDRAKWILFKRGAIQ